MEDLLLLPIQIGAALLENVFNTYDGSVTKNDKLRSEYHQALNNQTMEKTLVELIDIKKLENNIVLINYRYKNKITTIKCYKKDLLLQKTFLESKLYIPTKDLGKSHTYPFLKLKQN